MKKIIHKKSAVPMILFGFVIFASLVSCTSTQGMYSENDGIYESTIPPIRANSEQVVIITDGGSGQKYQKYFETEANNIYAGEDEIFTDVDTYSSYNDTLQGNVIINNYYNEGGAPWGYSEGYATVNFNMGYGGYWGYPYYDYYNPWYWGYGGYYGGYWGYGGWGYGGYWGGYYPGYYPPYYAGYYPPYYGDSTYGKRSNYSVRGSENTAYNRTSSNQYSRSSQASTRPNIYRESVNASASGTNRSAYQRSSGTRGYNNPSGNRNYNSSGNQGYNRSNTRSSAPSYNTSPRSSSGGSMRSSSGGGGYRRGPDMVQQDNDARSSDLSLTASNDRVNSSEITGNTNRTQFSGTGEGLASANRKVMSNFNDRTRYVRSSQTANRESLIASAMNTNRKVMANFGDRVKYVRSSVSSNSNNSGQSGNVYSRSNAKYDNTASKNESSGQRSSYQKTGNSESGSSANRQSSAYQGSSNRSGSGGSYGGGSYSRSSSGGSNGGGYSGGGSQGGASSGGYARGGSSR